MSDVYEVLQHAGKQEIQRIGWGQKLTRLPNQTQPAQEINPQFPSGAVFEYWESTNPEARGVVVQVKESPNTTPECIQQIFDSISSAQDWLKQNIHLKDDKL